MASVFLELVCNSKNSFEKPCKKTVQNLFTFELTYFLITTEYSTKFRFHVVTLHELNLCDSILDSILGIV